MSTYDSGKTSFGGSSFYSEPHPENIGSPVVDTNTKEEPASTTPPPYTHYSASGDEFAPSPMIDPEVQEAAEPSAAPPMISLPLIAAGLFALWLIFKGDR